MNYSCTIEESRRKLLRFVEHASDVTFVRAFGNIGDHLIYAGVRRLLSGVDHEEVSLRDIDHVTGHTALLSGSGGWCQPHHEMPPYLPKLERNFERVVILPSSFDVSVDCVCEALAETKATVFAREVESFRAIQKICRAELAHDTAFFFNYEPYKRVGRGVLNAFRTDSEARRDRIPNHNNDISVTCETLDEWLWAIARPESIRTDRAHVMIAAAMLGKRVEYDASSYHKLPGIADFALRDYSVSRIEEEVSLAEPAKPFRTNVTPPLSAEAEAHGHRELQREGERAVEEIASIVPLGEKFIFVDDARLSVHDRHPVPFPERDGEYWGRPEDDAVAIRELDRLAHEGAKFVIFTWSTFWWLDYYAGFRVHLETNFRQIFKNERLVVFDLRR